MNAELASALAMTGYDGNQDGRGTVGEDRVEEPAAMVSIAFTASGTVLTYWKE